jgi:hypothetical protein
MRAKVVNFQRGGNPRDTLGIGHPLRKEFQQAVIKEDRKFAFDKILELLRLELIDETDVKKFIILLSDMYYGYRDFVLEFSKALKVDWIPERETLILEFFWDESKSIRTVIKKVPPGNEGYTRKMTSTVYDDGVKTSIKNSNAFYNDPDHLFNPILMFNQVFTVYNEANIHLE